MTSCTRQRSRSGKSPWLLMALSCCMSARVPYRIACLNLERVQMLQIPESKVCHALAAVLGLPLGVLQPHVLQ